MKWSIGVKLATGFGLALAILLVIGGVSLYSINKLVDTAKWVEHSNQVIAQLEGITSQLDDAETSQRGYLLTGNGRFLQPYFNAQSSLTLDSGPFRQARQLTRNDPYQQNDMDKLDAMAAAKMKEIQSTIDMRQVKGLQAAADMVEAGTESRSMQDIRDIVADMKNHELRQLDARSQDATVSNATETIILGTTLAFLVVLGTCYWITRSIAGPLRQITGVAARISSGDISVDVNANGRADEVGELTRTFSRMTLSLRELTSQITEGINVLGASASEILASTTELAATATETTMSINETTSTVEEIRQTSQVASQKARAVAESAQNAARISQTGKRATEESIEGMRRIREQMESIADSMVRLSEQSKAIGEIITVVDDLAQQSNLLAVNAAIEAAKAGEQGKGFAVVAQEVRSLAEQSRQATTQVRTILSDVQKATGAAVMATEQGSKAVETGMTQSVQAGEAIVTLADNVAEAAQAAAQIAASSQQQLVGMDQVVQAMESVKQASAQNVDGARQLEAAARGLTELGQRLKRESSRYQVKGAGA